MDWKSQTIAPVGNPIYFEDPFIRSGAQPIFMEHRFPKTFEFAGGKVPLGGDVQVYALQLRWAVTERFALIATKDGYIDMKPDKTLEHTHGWANIAAGFKYALVDRPENEFILTPGLTFELPTGNTDVQQGRGEGEWNLFVSAAKGFGRFHTTGNVGFRLPNNFNDQTAQAHYSLQLDYNVCRYFIPFFVANGYTVLSEGEHKLLGAVDLNTELYDLINFGSTEASGKTQFTVGGGLRSKIYKNVELGFAYEAGVSSPVGIFDDRFTVDLIWRF
ncbi:MAG: hypothetical protein U1G07_26380 [Verrucomicrobiota bacterium]